MREVLTALLLLAAVLNGDGASIPEYDTIVVGLGSAGTTAATTLARAGRRVLALEAQDYVGGRVHTVPVGNGVVEVGAEWIHGTNHSRVYELALQNNIPVKGQVFNTILFRSDGGAVDEELVQDIMDYSLRFIDSGVPPGEDEAESLGVFLTKSVTEYIKEKYPEAFEDKDFMELIFKYLELTICSHQGCTSWNDVSTVTKYERLGGDHCTSWQAHGYKTFFEILLNKYNNGPGLPSLEIKLNKEVTQITMPQDPAQRVTVKCKDGAVYTADNVIVTVSLGVLKERHTTLFSPPLPQEKVAAIQDMSMGCIGKIILSFENAWWTSDKSYSFGFLWTKADRQQLSDEDKWLENIAGPSFSMGNNNTITLWSTIGIVTDALPENTVKEKSMQLLRRFITNITIPEPTGIIRSAWCINPYTLGSYTYDNTQFYQHPNARVTLAQPLVDSAGTPRVLFAGEATDEIHHSTVHGASDTGYREAMRLLNPK